MDVLDIEQKDIDGLPDDWVKEIEIAELKTPFNLDVDALCKIITHVNQHLLGDDPQEEVTKAALRESIDFNKLNQLLPKLHYASGKFTTLTKQHLVDYFLLSAVRGSFLK